MCDYSLGLVASRPAKVGDELVKRSSRTPSREDSPQSESQTWQCAFYPARRSRSKRKSSTSAFFAPFPIMKFGRLEKKVAQFRQIYVAARASRCAGVPRRGDRAAHPAVRRPARNGAAVARFAPGERSGGAKARFARELIGRFPGAGRSVVGSWLPKTA